MRSFAQQTSQQKQLTDLGRAAMPVKKKGKGKKKGGAATKKKKTVPDGTNAAACKKILRLYQQKSDLSHSVSFRSLVQELTKCAEEDKPLEKVRSAA